MDFDILHKQQFLVEITNRISKVERQMFNVMLLEIKEIILKQERYEMELSTLQIRMGKDFKPKYDRVRDMLKKLSNTKIDLLIFNEKGKEIGFQETQLLVEPSLVDGVIRWEYGSFMRKQLAEQSAFAQLNLEIQKRFLTKHALALWEWFSMNRGFLNEGQKNISMGEKKVEEIKKLLGLEGKYPNWIEFNRTVIKPSINEINEYSDLHVSVKLRKKQRRVIAMTFIINLKEQPKSTEIKTISPEPESLLDRMIMTGIAERSALQFLKKFSDSDILSLLKYRKTYTKPIEDINAWFNKGLIERYWETPKPKTGVPSEKNWWSQVDRTVKDRMWSTHLEKHPNDRNFENEEWKKFKREEYEKALQPTLF